MYRDSEHSLWKELLSLSPNPSDLQKFDLCQAYLVVFEHTKKRLANIKIYISFIIIKIIKYEILVILRVSLKFYSFQLYAYTVWEYFFAFFLILYKYQ